MFHPKKPLILIIEDELQILRLLAGMLGNDFEIITASTFEEAADVLCNNHMFACAVLLDGNLHEVNTLPLVQLLEEAGFDLKKVIAMSGNPTMQEALINAGCFQEGLAKPFSGSKVWKVLESAGITAARTT